MIILGSWNPKKREESIDGMFDFKEILSKVKVTEDYYNGVGKQHDSILSTKYQVNYLVINPMISNSRQTFHTNLKQIEFVKRELTVGTK